MDRLAGGWQYCWHSPLPRHWLACSQSYAPTNKTLEGAGQCQRTIIEQKEGQNQSRLHMFTLPVILFAKQIVAVYWGVLVLGFHIIKKIANDQMYYNTQYVWLATLCGYKDAPLHNDVYESCESELLSIRTIKRKPWPSIRRELKTDYISIARSI